jgi:hypothetical protein
VTLIDVPLVPKRYAGVDGTFRPQAGHGPGRDRPAGGRRPGRGNPYARYPAGPELLPKLSSNAHVFIDDADRLGELDMVDRWRTLYPALGVRKLPAEKGCAELFFRDEKKLAA